MEAKGRTNGCSDQDNGPPDGGPGAGPPGAEARQQQQQQDADRGIGQQQPPPPPVPSAQDAHTREKLFDFIALLQGRRMDDQRATLKPSS